ncbi:hypothetical protein F9278_11300 [Streptomyces phaeolivaceus]|uniref:Uncharacterized protein n=1 Tax=Streptomyces phaeolivaceus TaxID=2653200 RepID=A0A5P8K104_9ACTN|nr:hypothetical protein [Streptomyces phaeolivaceus]QFQ96714.1 hypothetical protein F9278_11300 [Streptomyces phaeolivaceus]
MNSRTKNTSRDPKRSWSSALRSPWTVACATAVVVLGPSAVTASALDRANSAPLHGASAPEHPAPGRERPRHAQPYTTEQYAYLPRTPSRGLRA